MYVPHRAKAPTKPGRPSPQARFQAIALAVGALFLLGPNLALAKNAVARVDVGLVAVSTRDLGVAQIWRFGLDGSGAQELTKGPAQHYSPKISPDGARVTYTTQNGNDFSVWTMNIDGSAQTQLTKTPLSAGTPAWSPDGSQIVFAGTKVNASGYQIWTMQADGSGQKQLVNLPKANDSSPAWSPDGSQIAFSDSVVNASGTSISRIDTFNLNTRSVTPITAGPGDGYLSWTDTGFLFARASADGKTSQIFQQSLGGSPVAQSPAGQFYTEPQPSADGLTYIATGLVGTNMSLFSFLLGSTPGPGSPLALGGGDTYNPVLIAQPLPAVPSPALSPSTAPIGVTVAPSAGTAPSAAPSGVSSTAVPPSSRDNHPLNPWEILIGVGLVMVVIGGITYYVKLKPKKDGCDRERAAELAAEAEFAAAVAGMNAAEATHEAAVARRHEAEAALNWLSDRPDSPKVGPAQAALEAAQSAEDAAYAALVAAGTRQGAARLNLEVARKRLDDCCALNDFIAEAWDSLPPAPEVPAPEPPPDMEAIRRAIALPPFVPTDAKTGRPLAFPPLMGQDPGQPHLDLPTLPREPVDPEQTPPLTPDGYFDPPPPSVTPTVEPPPDRPSEIG
jgi:hypothetical protein